MTQGERETEIDKDRQTDDRQRGNPSLNIPELFPKGREHRFLHLDGLLLEFKSCLNCWVAVTLESSFHF